jgi:hypothetical protein
MLFKAAADQAGGIMQQRAKRGGVGFHERGIL